MNTLDWKDYTNAELNQAELSRQSGNEGRARVCARRAAGHIIIEYYRRTGTVSPGEGAYSRIQHLSTQPGISDRSREILKRLMLRVTPEHTLPVEADLISDVHMLAKDLIGEEL
jgi:hypothetical protein